MTDTVPVTNPRKRRKRPMRVILGYETEIDDQGCWGSLQTGQSLMPQIYVNNGYNPQCYLAAQGSKGELVIASNVR